MIRFKYEPVNYLLYATSLYYLLTFLKHGTKNALFDRTVRKNVNVLQNIITRFKNTDQFKSDR